MMKTCLFAVLAVVLTSGVARAGGQEGSIGVGAEYQLSGLGGASMNYDAGMFHAGAFFSFYDAEGANNTIFEVGGRFFYHLHSTAMSDFGLGGNLGIASVPEMGSNNSLTFVFVEPALQIRLFLASNVALSASAGVIIGVADASGVAVTGQTITGAGSVSGVNFSGAAGIHYYFF